MQPSNEEGSQSTMDEKSAGGNDDPAIGSLTLSSSKSSDVRTALISSASSPNGAASRVHWSKENYVLDTGEKDNVQLVGHRDKQVSLESPAEASPHKKAMAYLQVIESPEKQIAEMELFDNDLP